MLKKLGASEVFDYASPSIVDDVIAALRGRRLAGTLHATGSIADCFAVVGASEGVRTVAATLTPLDRAAERRGRDPHHRTEPQG